MAKNIVVCCDGTGNEVGERISNVVKLHSVLVEGPDQRVFYDPGVGTFPVRQTLTKPARSFQKILGLAFGYGFRQNVMEAYSFIMKTYEEGDRIYLFGFSRGAYTARVVAGLIHSVGILRDGQENLIPYALRYCQRTRRGIDWARLSGFKKRFARDPDAKVHFLGVWDTVSSVSWLWDRLVFSATATNKSVSTMRHAVAIDERRAFFRTNLWNLETSEEQDAKEVWFAGVHCDIGGSYDEEECGLSKLSLEWMLVEAINHGLAVDIPKAKAVIDADQAPDPLAKQHNSLTLKWLPCEFVPKRPYYRGRRRFRINLGRRRHVPDSPVLHQSVDIRLNDAKLDYKPANLPKKYTVEIRKPI